MSKLELTLNPNYVPSWTVENALRELIQNCVDANDIGYPMKIAYNSNRKEPTLTLTNTGTTIGRDSLLLGSTTKLNDNRQRGCFGEGMKLGWLVLLRAGLKIWIKSGDEKWVPNLAYSDTYKSDLLTVETGKATYENAIVVEVRGLEPDVWEEFRQHILFSPGVELNRQDFINAGKDSILTREDLRGKLFVRGLYVGHLPGEYWFGYNFFDIKLDRDRKLADPWDLKNAIRTCLNTASERGTMPIEDMYLMLNGDRWEEQRIIADTWSASMVSELTYCIASYFHKENGKDCIPVETTSESMDAAQHGLRSKVVSRAIKTLVEFVDGKFQDKKNSKATETNRTYGFEELTKEEQDNIFWAKDCLDKIKEPLNINIVDFYGEHILGNYRSSSDICIAKKILTDKSQFIATIVHEISHRAGGDDDVAHRNEEEKLFGNLIHKISESLNDN